MSSRRGGYSNRRGKNSKYQFVKKTEKGNEEHEDSNSGSRSKSKINLIIDDNHEKGENSASGLGSKLNLDCDNGEKNGENINMDVSTSSENINMDDTGKRFDELRLSFKEPELSEEQIRINSQLQEDELLAMESIYGDNIFILDNQIGLKHFQIHIHVELPKGLLISTKFNSSEDFSYTFRVEYLPPIILTCSFPKSYPSHIAPCFTISVQWLDSSKISDLCRKLDSIWQEQAGQEIIYQWVEWLHSCTLSYFDIDQEMNLGPYGVNKNGDLRAISESVSPDVDVPLLKSYDDAQRHENFCRNVQECCICFSKYPGSEFARLPCQHFFCCNCMKTFCEMHIKEGTLSKLSCLDFKCDGTIPPGLLKRLVGEETFNCWESLMLQKTLESMADVVYCPRCETGCLEDEDNHAQCSKCYYSYCTLCRERRHVGVECMPPDMKLIILQERQNSSQIKGDQRRREKDMINQLLSMREITRFAKQCPSCKMAISRTEGCNKMVCENCGEYFCYKCNKAISGYDHFRNGSCEIFPAEEIERWNEMNARQVVGQIQVQIYDDRGHQCPICRQINVKMNNNNHIFCWSCQNHYCYLCKKIVRRSSQHFGPKGCKQHTVG